MSSQTVMMMRPWSLKAAMRWRSQKQVQSLLLLHAWRGTCTHAHRECLCRRCTHAGRLPTQQAASRARHDIPPEHDISFHVRVIKLLECIVTRFGNGAGAWQVNLRQLAWWRRAMRQDLSGSLNSGPLSTHQAVGADSAWQHIAVSAFSGGCWLVCHL